ncbi:multiheme c-type cytochrome [Geoalkalibacter sp.]|uniref:multiheme c-type cytochrome n=1 Tax=Geoalkalibacter sp. TaxID=3041440 RepID=UPI00272E9E1A|nr:cytochrome c3 family protein [Geoalkalibacter sp.]
MKIKAKHLFFLFIMYFLAFVALVAVPAGWAMEAEDCLMCHGDAGMVGDALFVDGPKFATTLHAELGCVACHADVTAEHPDDGLKLGKVSCSECHADMEQDYNAGIHAGLASCNDCHNPHSARASTEVSGYDMNQMCTGCHVTARVVDSHDRWLPQAGLHIEAVPCITCHTGSENIVITWYLVKQKKAYGDFELLSPGELATLAGEKDITVLIDTDNDGHVSLAELRAFNTSRDFRGLHLVGMMTPEQVSHNFQILDNRWDCTFCHASGPSAMQVSYVAFPQDDGSFLRLDVERGAALDALYGTPNFYMVGATRNKVMDILGAMIIAGGLVLPVGHGTMRFLTRKNRQGGH